MATSARELATPRQLRPSTTCRAVAKRYPAALARRRAPAPRLFEAVSWRLNHRRRAGVITATRGFSSAATVVLDMAEREGSCGNRVLSSRSLRALLTIAGTGTKEMVS